MDRTAPGLAVHAPQAPRALVVDDEPALLGIVTKYLERDGFTVSTASDGLTALHLARERQPDVIVLDVMLPGMDGIETCRRIRTFSDAYVLMLTARTDEVDKLVGLSVGADDYVTKPFSPRELVARARVLLRRPRERPVMPPRVVGDLVLDPAAREVTVGGTPVDLTRTEFDLLDALTADPRMTLRREQLLAAVWGEWYGDPHVVDVHIANLRRKLGDDAQHPRFVQTVRGVGYRLGTGR